MLKVLADLYRTQLVGGQAEKKGLLRAILGFGCSTAWREWR